MKHNTNWKKELLPDNTCKTGNWYCGAINSEYHFDENIQDQPGEWFDLLGRFDLDFSAEVERLSSSIGSYEDDPDYYKKTYEQIVNLQLTKKSGSKDDYSKSYVSLSMFNGYGHEMFPLINKVARYFDIVIPKGKEANAGYRTIMQTNGQMYNLHVDNLWEIYPEDPSKIVRITVMLDNWHPGQFFMYGNYVYKNWKAGDVHIFDWANVPHATANASNIMRPNLQITGLATDRTRLLLSQMNKDTIIKLEDL